jgi:hypothetical protein
MALTGTLTIGSPAQTDHTLNLDTSGDYWTTSSWEKAIFLPNASVLRWPVTSGRSWGIGQSADILYFISSTADDDSAAASTTGRILNDGTSNVFDFVGRLVARSSSDNDDNANQTVGLTLKQNVFDDEILTLKSSDVSHALTNITEADTYGYFAKQAGNYGGLTMHGITDYSEAGIGLHLKGSASSHQLVDSEGAIHIVGNTESSNSEGAIVGTRNVIVFQNYTQELGFFDGSGQLYVGNSFISNTNMTRGITINQAGYDDEILTLKSSDVAHGVTGQTETDTYAHFQKLNAGEGGLKIQTYSEAFQALVLNPVATTDSTAKGAAGYGPVRINVLKKDGISIGAVGPNANLLSIETNTAVKWHLDEDGDTYQDGDIMPFDAGTQNIGASGSEWDNIWCNTLHTSGGTVNIGDARLYAIDGLLYSETEILAPSGSDPSALVTNAVLTAERTQYGLGHDHDERYYTETEVDTNFAPTPHNNSDHSETYITTTGVTYGALDGNSDIGTGSDQVAQGDHVHAYSAITGSHGNEDHSSTFIAGVSGDISPQLGGDLDLNGNSIDFGAILTSNGTYEGKIITVTVDTSASFGSVLAQAADFNYDPADADAATQSDGLVIVVDEGTGSRSVLIEGQVCNTAWNWSAGFLYLSTTAGAMTQTAPSGSGDQVVVVGWALSADTVYFRPSPVLAEIA